MLEVNHAWTSTGSSGGLTPIYVDFPPEATALYCQSSTIASTQSFSIQTALSSGGPWVTEASTAVTADANGTALDKLTITSPYTWIRPRLNSASTGTYTLRLVGTSGA